MTSKADIYFTRKKNCADADLSAKFSELEEFYSKKLWHQLTLSIEELVKFPEMKKGTELVDLYTNLINELENKINPLSLIELAGEVITQISDPNAAIAFIEKVAPKVVDHKEAKVLCNILISQVALYRLEDHQKAKKTLEETEKHLDELDGVFSVHRKFYFCLSELHCQTGAHAEYYRATLHYLGCADLKDLTIDEKRKRAFYLGLAAILGEGIYNFGELLAHPILESLRGGSDEWLMELLFVFNAGNLPKFESMKPQWSTQPDLLAKENQLREKNSTFVFNGNDFQKKGLGQANNFLRGRQRHRTDGKSSRADGDASLVPMFGERNH